MSKDGSCGLRHERPGLGGLLQLQGEGRVKGMTRLRGFHVADDRMPEERQVADPVEDLVAHELVLEAQLVVEDPGLTDHDGVVEASPEGQAAPSQHLDLPQEAEGARRGDLFRRRSRA